MTTPRGSLGLAVSMACGLLVAASAVSADPRRGKTARDRAGAGPAAPPVQVVRSGRCIEDCEREFEGESEQEFEREVEFEAPKRPEPPETEDAADSSFGADTAARAQPSPR